MSNKALIVLLGLVVITLTGCVSSSKTCTYILCPDDSVAKQYNAIVTVSGIELPEYLDKNTIAVRVSKHTIGSLTGHQWAQNFRKMIQNSLTADLLLRAMGSKDAPVFSVYVQIQRFELDENNNLNVNANCVLSAKTPRGASQSFVFANKYLWGGSNVEDLIGFYDKAISDMAELIAGKAVGL